MSNTVRVANAHLLQVNPGIGFLCTLKGFRFFSGYALLDNPFVRAPPVLNCRA